MLDTLTSLREKTIHLLDGFTMRPALMTDVDAVVSMLNAYSRWLLDADKYKPNHVLTDWKLPGFNMQEYTRVVIAPDGTLAGYAELWDMIEPYVKKNLWARVHPAYKGLGIGTALTTWAEEQSLSMLDRSPKEARVVLQMTTSALDDSALGIFEHLDYQYKRTFWRMVIELDKEPQPPTCPDGITIRSIIEGEEERSAIAAVYESFQDHWGFIPESFEAYLTRYLYYVHSNEDYDPALWFVALDQTDGSGQQVAGVSLCSKKSYDDPYLGWVGTLGVRRPWRKRGLGLALLQHSFVELYQRGQRRIGLGVDASSLTGATRIYEKAGMHSDPRFTIKLYEKELRPGVDLLVHSIE